MSPTRTSPRRAAPSIYRRPQASNTSATLASTSAVADPSRPCSEELATLMHNTADLMVTSAQLPDGGVVRAVKERCISIMSSGNLSGAAFVKVLQVQAAASLATHRRLTAQEQGFARKAREKTQEVVLAEAPVRKAKTTLEGLQEQQADLATNRACLDTKINGVELKLLQQWREELDRWR